MVRVNGRPGALIVFVAVAGVVLLLAQACGIAQPPAADPVAPTPASAPDPAPDPSPGGETDAPAEPTPTLRPTGQLSVPTVGWRTDFETHSVDLSEIISGGPGKDGIPPIDQPRFEDLATAREWLDERAPVIALEIAGEARAYPLAILMWHEIVNDELGGVPVVVTFCPLCNTALVFEGELDGVVYDFGTTGNLRFSDLVMYDRQTESWWQQATGEAIVGELTGTRLQFVPSQLIALGDFVAAYPGSEVLSRDTGHRRDYGRNPYAGYDTIEQNPFLFRGVVDGRMAPMERVAAVRLGSETVAYPFAELAKVGVVHDEIGGEPVVVFWRPGVASALDTVLIDDGRDVGATGVFSPLLDGRQLTFEVAADGSFVDRETGSRWSITGAATDGELAGQRLEPLGHGDYFWFAWAAFEPETRIWTAPE